MLTFLTAVLTDLLCGDTQKHLDAAEAFNDSPQNATAVRYRCMALALFVISSVLLVLAAVFHMMANQPLLSNVLGWSGIVALLASSWLGRRYAAVNR